MTTQKLTTLKTEDRIKDVTKQLLFRQGLFTVTTQQLSEYAGIERTAIHYYFHSKKNLIDTVIREVTQEFSPLLPGYMEGLAFEAKLERYIAYYAAKYKKYPYLDVYLITQYELKDHTEKILNPFGELIPEIMIWIRNNNTEYAGPADFLAHLLSIVNGYYISMDFLRKRQEFLTAENQTEPDVKRILRLLLKPAEI